MSINQQINIKLPGSFIGLLTILFIGLKLTNYIDWSWLWVLAPLWIPITLILLIALAILCLYFIVKY
jgi:hypothetical protein